MVNGMKQYFQMSLGSPVCGSLSQKHLLYRKRTLSTSGNTILTGQIFGVHTSLTFIGHFCHPRKYVSYRCLCLKNILHPCPFLGRMTTFDALCTQQGHQD